MTATFRGIQYNAFYLEAILWEQKIPGQAFANHERVEKYRSPITIHLVRGLLSGLLVLVLAGPVWASAELCGQVFPVPHSVPNMHHVVAALTGLLQKPAESKYFYEPNWRQEEIGILANPVYNFAQRIEDSKTAPTYLGNKMSLMAGGVGFFHYNMFAEGNFRQQKVVVYDSKVRTADIAKTETWFEWHPESGTYQERRGGTVKPLLTPFLMADGHRVKLYRGLSAEQAELFARLKKGDTEVLNQLFTARKDAVFFSPSKEAAKLWGGEGRVVELTFELSDLMESYAGLEYNYVEVAIWQPEVLMAAISSLKILRR
ncbi:MAG: hypothetical protein JSU04_19510 [Bdellovibrionales bacterium]|nr:hypothetical protein [Bdellovibrionales bacterium]